MGSCRSVLKYKLIGVKIEDLHTEVRGHLPHSHCLDTAASKHNDDGVVADLRLQVPVRRPEHLTPDLRTQDPELVRLRVPRVRQPVQSPRLKHFFPDGKRLL